MPLFSGGCSPAAVEQLSKEGEHEKADKKRGRERESERSEQ